MASPVTQRAQRRPQISALLRLASWLGALCLVSSLVHAQSPILSEFMAANASVLKDADGEWSDWVELHNPDPVPVTLSGWSLTDDPANLQKWRFPDITLPGHGFLVVFASGKDRVDPKAELHANFSLDRAGEYLALVKPDGVTVVSSFAPLYPKQATDVSYGRSMATQVSSLVPAGAAARVRVPAASGMPAEWAQPEFDDGGWASTVLSIGYFRANASGPEPVEPPPALEDVTRPGDELVATSLNSPANEGVGNAIDNTSVTKYLNFDKLNAGFTVTPRVGASVVSGLRLTSANDAPDRDPTTYLLLGSNDGSAFTQIARGAVPTFTARFMPVTVSFPNTNSYRHYRLLFPTVQNAGAAVAMQISEVEFLGYAGAPPSDFDGLIRSNVESVMFGKSTSAFVRVPFALAEIPDSGQLTLRLRYEDGFVAYLNGVEVARANVPTSPVASSAAVTNRLQRAAAIETRIDLTSRFGLLRPGKNVLALHGLNTTSDSREFLLDAQLELLRTTVGEVGHLIQPTPGGPNDSKTGGLVDDLAIVPARGFYSSPIDVRITCPTPDTLIRYTTNGSVPSATNGLVYNAPLRIASTTPLRAVAVRPDWRASSVETHTYVFLDDVVLQTQAKALQAGLPASWGGVVADYGLDSRVVGPNGTDSYGGKYTRTLKSDLQSLPTLSIVMPVSDMFGAQGIYSNPLSHGAEWERPTSIEWLNPDNQPGFQEDAGIRIQGGAFRRFDLTLKKSFRVVFRDQYGSPRLKFSLFGTNATDRFDNFVLRANSNDAWPYAGGAAVYVRDAFAMETARALGIPSSHTRFVHLYINGQYWGLYNPAERPDAAFSEAYFGGNKGTWDSINQDSAPDGNYDAWNRMIAQTGQNMTVEANYQKIQGNNPDGTRNPNFEDLLNIDNLIDYLILNFYVGNTDWPGRNWWAGRDRENGDGFTFRPWDTETALGFTPVDVNVTGVSDAVARPYAAVRSNPNFKMAFADHVYRHFFNGGPLAVNPASPAWNPARPENNRPAQRFAALADSIRSAVVGESARWGDQLRSQPTTRDEHWQTERDRLLRDYFPRRSAIVLDQFRSAGLYPRTEPPVMNQRGGEVPAGFQLTLTAPRGIIYYTTNGTDPRAALGRLTYTGPIVLQDLTTLRTRVLNGQEWSALNEARFVVGTPTLGVSELHYHPADPSEAEVAAGFTNADDFEFIELVNTGATAFDLRGARFTKGIQFEFDDSIASQVSVGAYVVLVRNRAAFQRRYGMSRTVAGEYSGRFDNAGEQVVLVDARGRTLLNFTYQTTRDWPQSPDGQGPSLEVRDPSRSLDFAVNWQASSLVGGTPGEANTPPELVLSLEPFAANFLRVRFTARAGQTYTVQTLETLGSQTWRVLQRGGVQPRSVPVQVLVNTDPNATAQFFRVTIP